MKLAPMRFNGYTWHHNPKKLELKCEKKVVSLDLPYSSDVLHNFGDKVVKISGIGELYGEDCLKQFEALQHLYKSSQLGILCLPKLMPLKAYFDKLELLLSDTPNVLKYSFSFSSIPKAVEDVPLSSVHFVKENETLWDIAYEHDLSVETLLTLNPDVMFLNDLSKLKVVKLC